MGVTVLPKWIVRVTIYRNSVRTLFFRDLTRRAEGYLRQKSLSGTEFGRKEIVQDKSQRTFSEHEDMVRELGSA